MEVKEVEVHPEIEKILNYVIPARKVRNDLLTNENGVRVGDLIDRKVDIRFDNYTGKPMMVHSGILSIWDGIGAEFLEPKLEKTGPAEYQVVQGVRFADGTTFYSTGEASHQNTDNRELSGKFPVNQAHIRAVNKALIRGLGLYRVLLTEEESDEFKETQTTRIQQQYEDALLQVRAQAQDKERRLLMLIEGMMELISLPESDEKYPNRYITEITEDKDYLESLKTGENKIVGFVANQFLKKRESESSIKDNSVQPEENLINEDQTALEDSQESLENFETQKDEQIAPMSESDINEQEVINTSDGEGEELKVASQDANWVTEGEQELSASMVSDSVLDSNKPTEDEDSDIKYLEEFFGDITAQIEMDEQENAVTDQTKEVLGDGSDEEKRDDLQNDAAEGDVNE